MVEPATNGDSAPAAAPVVAIDGPSGVGKGTLCNWLAATLGWHLLDSGALYRLTAFAALTRGFVMDRAAQQETELAELARGLAIRFEPGPDGNRILLDDRPVGDAIRTEACGDAASRVAALPAVRAALLALQRSFQRPPGLIADGRDMGTVVFPDAAMKIFLTASAEERAKRRYKQLKEKGIGASLSALAQNIAERDARDAARPVAPLRPADDAVVVDTTGLSIADVRQRALALIHQKIH